MIATAQRIGHALSTARQLAADQAGQAFASINSRYDLLSAYYWNEQYASVNAGLLKSSGGLYRNTRPVRNPIARAADSYPERIYPGAMTVDGLPLPDGTPCCIPFSADTEEDARLAMTQVMLWANWGVERWQFIRNLVILGDAFAEIEVDYDRGVAYPKFHHPGRVKDMEWNGSGDVVMYELEIPMKDDRGVSYKWGKRVDKDSFVYLMDGHPHGYDGQPAEIENEYGFVPAAWGQFRNVGGQHGAALADIVRTKLDELNSSLSSVHDYIQKFVNQGIIISAPGGLKAFEEANTSRASGGATADRANPQGGRQELPFTFVPKDTTFFKPLDNLGLADALEHLRDQIKEVEADLPESTIEERIQQMSTPPSGRALRLMFGSAGTRYQECGGNADHLLVKCMQMATSVMAYEVRSGRFGKARGLTAEQRKFLPFSLDSFKAGALSTTLMPRHLFPDSPMDNAQLAIARESIQTVQGLIEAGYSLDEIYGVDEGGKTLAPPVIPGLMEQRQGASSSTADLLGRALGGGNIGG